MTEKNVLRAHCADGKILEFQIAVTPQTVAQCLWLSGTLSAPALCSGMGRCGQCRVHFRENAPEALPLEHELLGAAVEQGWRLACRHQARAGMELDIVQTHPEAIAPMSEACRLAVDLGTTSLQWKAFELGAESAPCRSGQELNPQMGAGSDVMSRIAFAGTPSGLERLHLRTREALERIVMGLGAPVHEICVAANPAMSAILLGKDCQGLAAAPYSLPLAGGAFRLEGLPPLWLPPQLAPFVGGDISAGFAAVLHDHAPRYPFILADMGTNGEFVLALSPQSSILTSVPLGPALEGIGLSCGMNAQAGAVHQVRLSPQGLELLTLENAMPRGLCGTGYLSLLLALRGVGLLDEAGHFCAAQHPLAQRIARFDAHNPQRLLLGHGLFLDARDIEELLKVKAAFSLAIESLLACSGSIQAVYLAGALGQNVPEGVLARLGFLPQSLAERTITIGNSALRGAELLLRFPSLRDTLSLWASTCSVLDLTAAPDFMARYAQQMRFA